VAKRFMREGLLYDVARLRMNSGLAA